jgi:hypothetical protein
MEHLHEFANNIWLADGPVVRDMGALFMTRMTIVKLSDGSIWVGSPVPVSFATLRAISELGEVRYLVAATPRLRLTPLSRPRNDQNKRDSYVVTGQQKPAECTSAGV